VVEFRILEVDASITKFRHTLKLQIMYYFDLLFYEKIRNGTYTYWKNS